MWLIAARAWSSISSVTHRVKSLDKNAVMEIFLSKEFRIPFERHPRKSSTFTEGVES
jgi:hypothetical protein